MKNYLPHYIGLLTLALTFQWVLASPDKGTANGCIVVKIEAKTLPDLNIPRAGHQLFYANGELTVAGGHTDGFVPTPTAEYLKDGQWHLMDMKYNHDFGYSVILKNGKVLLGGGSEQPIGIGQTFLAELYNPQTHTFNGFGSMERKRTLASALEMDNGQVVISGNWYHDDGIEVFDGKKRFTYIKNVVNQLSAPHIFRISKDDALIVGFTDTRGDTLFSAVADRLKGDTVHIPLLESWLPLSVQSHRDAESFIGDATKEAYTYLMPVQNKNGQVAIAKVENGMFSLLPTEGPVPMQCQGNDIDYLGHVVVDRKAERAYLMGCSNHIRTSPEKESPLYFLCIDYVKALSGQPAPLTLYYTDPLPVVPDYPPVVTDEGNLVIAGGLRAVSNFTPSKAVWLLPFGEPSAATEEAASLWIWLLLLLAGLAVAATIYLFSDYKRKHRPVVADGPDTNTTGANDELMTRITDLMESERIYLNSELKVFDVAARLGTNISYISDCIRTGCGCSFTNFVNGYRIRHAQELLRQHPDRKITQVCFASGFANEQTFFRIFKATTGMTPKEWIAQND